MPEDIPARRARQAGYYHERRASGQLPVRDWVWTEEDRAYIHAECRRLREGHEREEAQR